MTPEQREELKQAASAANSSWPSNAEFRVFSERANPSAILSLIAQVEAQATEREKLLNIIASAYQIAGAHDASELVLDVLSDPLAATDAQIEALLPYQVEALTVPQWISVEDRLPPIGEEVIVFVPNGRVPVTALMRLIRWEGSTDFYWDNAYPGKGNMHIATSITHWKPMDATPTIPAIPGTKEAA